MGDSKDTNKNKSGKENNSLGIKDQEAVFVEEYVTNGFKATGAYMAAYDCKVKSTAGVEGSKLLKKPNIKKAIKKEMKSYLDSYGATKEAVFKELCIIAFSDITDYIDFAGDVVSIKSSEEIGIATKAIRELTITPVRTIDADGNSTTSNKINLKLHDKTKALENIARLLKMEDEPWNKKEVKKSLPDKVLGAIFKLKNQ